MDGTGDEAYEVLNTAAVLVLFLDVLPDMLKICNAYGLVVRVNPMRSRRGNCRLISPSLFLTGVS